MKTTQVPGTQGTKANGRAPRSTVPFVSICPMCAQVRPQPGYDRESLLRLIRNGYPGGSILFAMRRVLVDQHQGAHAALAAAVIAGGGSFVC